jgi:putative lipoic acid-binding regulatory protein
VALYTILKHNIVFPGMLHRYAYSFKSLFIEVLQGYSAPYSATSIYINADYNHIERGTYHNVTVMMSALHIKQISGMFVKMKFIDISFSASQITSYSSCQVYVEVN